MPDRDMYLIHNRTVAKTIYKDFPRVNGFNNMPLIHRKVNFVPFLLCEKYYDSTEVLSIGIIHGFGVSLGFFKIMYF